MNTTQHRVTGTIAAAVIGLGTLGAAALTMGSASAATHPVLSSTTQITSRNDNGGGGVWAHDTMTRTLNLTYLGKVTAKDIKANPALKDTPFMYSAQITDKGKFLDIPGKHTPNQGGKNHGKRLRPVQVSGPMSGVGQFNLFYASAKAHNGLVPSALKGAKLNSKYPSATWPELSFPAGTTFADVNEAFYDYTYQAVPVFQVKTVNGKKVTVIVSYKQKWEDASFNGDGQAPRAGNILGLR